MSAVGEASTDLLRSQQLSPLRYLVTEFSVLWVYIRLLQRFRLAEIRRLVEGIGVASGVLDQLQERDRRQLEEGAGPGRCSSGAGDRHGAGQQGEQDPGLVFSG